VRRILLLVTVALVMAAMMLGMAMPAFGAASPNANCIGEAASHQDPGTKGQVVSQEATRPGDEGVGEEVSSATKVPPHPIHIHGFQFRVLERMGTSEQVAHLVVDEKGRLVTDLGFKDTVLLWPGETVKWAIDFSHGFEGEQLYMFHCHILEHETAMMLNLKVV
jgi:hypothetical protein